VDVRYGNCKGTLQVSLIFSSLRHFTFCVSRLLRNLAGTKRYIGTLKDQASQDERFYEIQSRRPHLEKNRAEVNTLGNFNLGKWQVGTSSRAVGGALVARV
jgi:hypothetical protein